MTAVSVSNLHIATKDGECMFFDEVVDFSDAVGKWLEFVTSTGKKAVAYASAVGGGLASETNYTFDFSADVDSWVLVDWGGATGTFAHSVDKVAFVITTAGDNTNRPQLRRTGITGVEADALCFFELDYIINSGNCALQGVLIGGSGYEGTGATLAGTDTYVSPIKNTMAETYDRLALYFNGTKTFDSLWAGMRYKHVTDVPATGLLLVSTAGGSTRNMASVESGFDPNDVTTVNVLPSWFLLAGRNKLYGMRGING
jgi:hypothetical protein